MKPKDSTVTAPVDLVVAEPAPSAPADAVIERWYEDTFVNIGLDDQLANRIRAAVLRLKDLIAAMR